MSWWMIVLICVGVICALDLIVILINVVFIVLTHRDIKKKQAQHIAQHDSWGMRRSDK